MVLRFNLILDAFCGETFYVWDKQTKTFGKCFKQLSLNFPPYIFLLFVTSYYLGFRKYRPICRTRNEVLCIYIRILLCLLLSFSFPLQLYAVHLQSVKIVPVDLVQTIVCSITWLVHILYLRRFLTDFRSGIRGPVFIAISIFICAFISSYDVYNQCRISNFKFIDWFSVLNIIFQLFYLLTILPRNVEREYRRINTEFTEEEPLMSSVVSRYYGCEEEIDQSLGVAEDPKQIWSTLFFSWVQPLMVKGYNKNLNSINDLYDLPVGLQSTNIHKKISLLSDPFVEENDNFNFFCWSFPKKSFVLVKYLHKLFAYEFYSIGILKFISDGLTFGGPLLLNLLVSLLESPNSDTGNGYYYAFGLFLITFLSAIVTMQYNYLINRIALKLKAAIIIFVYKKTLYLNKVTLTSISTGEIMNYLSTDAERISNFCQTFHLFWSLPFQVMVALILLYQQLKYCFFIGVAFMLFVIPLNQYVAKKIAGYSNLMMKAKDKRIKIMNEIISGIRVIKMNVWETIFLRKLALIRQEEVKYLKKRKYLDAVCVYFWATTPVVMSFLTFTLYAVLGFELSASKVFTSVALFNILIMPLNAFPWILNGIIEAWISVKRVNGFLLQPTLDVSKYYSEVENSKIVLELVNAVLSYSREVKSRENSDNVSILPSISRSSAFCLGPLNLKLLEGQFLCIIGKVGSGKTSFLSSVLANLNCVSGKVKMNVYRNNGGIGYVSQSSWIQQKSIKENILFGKNLNILKYRKILEACALLEDLETLPHGDQTEVGDKGVTLSGGQKARISLARAVYQDFDIYLMDDPLSAVDAHVADHIYSNCIMGILKNKTRILCTHKTQFAENADHLVILSEGKILSQGPPNQALQFYPFNGEESDIEDRQETELIIKDKITRENKGSSVLVQKEEKEEGFVKLHVYRSYWKAVGSILPIIVLLFCFLMQASRTTSDWWLSFWVSSVHSNQNGSLNYSVFENGNELISPHKRTLSFYLYIYGGLALANSIFTLFRAFLFAWAGIKAALLLHNKLVNIVIKAKTSFFDMTPLGRIMNRFSSDVYCIDDAFPFILNILLAQVFALVGCIFITCYGLPWILLIILILSVIYFRIQGYYRWTSRELKRLSSISLSPIYAHLSETLDGQTTIRAMAATSRFLKEMIQYVDSNVRACLSMSAASQWLNLRLQFIGVAIVTSVALIALVEKEFGGVDAGLVGLALSYALIVTALLNGSIIAFTETEKEIVSVERVTEYVENVQTERSSCVQTPPFAWPSHGVISFINVSLRYRASCPYALKNISFETCPGEKIGIVGRTGSGKSSLIQILYQMVDSYEGTVLVDGVNIDNLMRDKLRSSLSVIPQDPFLFCGTVRENLDPCYQKSDSQVWKALQDCHLKEKVQSMGGLDVEVEEQGNNFSIGEKQLFCLTRALLRKAKVLCMDEATASVDYHTDSLIRHTVRLAFQRSTVLIVAHRIETILDCDRVLVMKEGEIAEMGKPSVLLPNPNSEFHQLVYSKTT